MRKLATKFIIMSCIMITFVFLSGCSTDKNSHTINNELTQDKSISVNSSLNNENSSDIKQIQYVIKEVSRGKFLERKIYSPDRKNYIRVVTNGEKDLSDSFYSFDLFLNSENQALDYKTHNYIESSISSKEAIWLNNKDVIILGEYIYNINTGEKVNLLKSDSKDNNTNIMSYAINSDLSQIAYIASENAQLNVYINDLKTNAWTKLYNEEIDITEDVFLNIMWVNSNIYFNIADQNVDNTISYKIMKYNMNNKEVSQYRSDKFLLNKSFDSNYLVFLDSKLNNTEILNQTNDKSLDLDYSYRLCWSETKDIFMYYLKDDPNLMKIMDLANNSQYNIEIPEYKDDYQMQNFRVESDKFMFDAVEYVDSDGTDIIDQVITYVIETK